MFIKRAITDFTENLFKKYPVLTITGPRQSGKTTLVKNLFSELPYVNLENPSKREIILTDPIGFLNKHPEGLILDEIQNCPDLISFLQERVDENRKNGLYILTGSQQFEVMNVINQSLAGRTGIIKLLPFSLSEIKSNYSSETVESIMYKGFYPRIIDQQLDPSQALSDYSETYLERDLRKIINIKNLNLFRKFLRLCAGRIGQLLNMSALSNETGVSHTTIKEWCSVLEASYIIFFLQPFYENISKRLVKMPKLYFFDVGLASFLLGIENSRQLETHPLKGNLFENMIIADILKMQYNYGNKRELSFFRDSSGNEIDLIFKAAGELIPVEIKSSSTFSKDFLKGFRAFENIFSADKVKKAFLIYNGTEEAAIGKVNLCNFWNMEEKFLS